MKECKFKSFDELPLFLNAETVADVLGISRALTYELFHEDDFPSHRYGNRLLVSKEHFIKWVDEKSKEKKDK